MSGPHVRNSIAELLLHSLYKSSPPLHSQLGVPSCFISTRAMAYRKTLAHRFLNMNKLSPSPSHPPPPPPPPPPHYLDRLIPNPTLRNHGFLKRFLSQSAFSWEKLPLPVGVESRIRLEGLPLPPPKTREEGGLKISAAEAKKALRAWQLEGVRKKLRTVRMEKSRISHAEFVGVCCDGAGGFEQGLEMAQVFDDAGEVIVIGNLVFLRPDEVAKAIESMVPLQLPRGVDDSQRKELTAMEEKKRRIDKIAERQVNRELWCGLGFLCLQTIGFMRLTFWELSWDVMEPVCFYVTSFYFMLGYVFFLRTSRDPSFEGFFQTRFSAKKKRLVKEYNFDVSKFDELKRCYPGPVGELNLEYSIK